MIGTFMDLSFSFVMDLYRTKVKAEKRGDVKAIESLLQHYPELFTDEFQEFIEKTQLVVGYLDQKYGENFSAIFSVEKEDIVEKTH
jgi:hypothetical protein